LYLRPFAAGALSRWRVDRAAEGAARGEAHVVEEDDEDVRALAGGRTSRIGG
jgi:hypothetical protein